MLEKDMKNKIINTISQYKKKCDNLQEDIGLLKNSLQQLTLLPMGIFVDLDTDINLLSTELKTDTNLASIHEKANVLILTISKLLMVKQETNQTIDTTINSGLNELLDHFAIPKDLELDFEAIKHALKKPLKQDTLKKVINDISYLFLDIFNLEQKQLKEFVQHISEQLHDFDSYLIDSSKNQDETAKESNVLEQGIQYNLDQIKTHLDSANSIKELSEKMKANLATIGSHIKEFREGETARNKTHEIKVKSLQKKLDETRDLNQDLTTKMSAQRLKINYDALTELPNRAAYDEHFHEAYNRWQREGGALSLAVADIDFFKTINDSYGHLAGDKVLRKISHILKGFVRTTDFVARFGGEEFVVIFEKTSTEDAEQVLEKIRVLIENCDFSYKNQKVNVTISFGLTGILKKDNEETFFARADKAMYAAKEAGRNRIVVF